MSMKFHFMASVVEGRAAIFLYMSSVLEKELRKQAAEQASQNSMDAIASRMSGMM